MEVSKLICLPVETNATEKNKSKNTPKEGFQSTVPRDRVTVEGTEESANHKHSTLLSYKRSTLMEGNWECLHRTVKRAPTADCGEGREGGRLFVFWLVDSHQGAVQPPPGRLCQMLLCD